MNRPFSGKTPRFPDPRPGKPRVKICGIRRPEDALLALDLGADFLGLIMTKKSPRYISEDEALELTRTVRKSAPSPARFIGVFVDESPEEIARLAADLDLLAVQVHGPVENLPRAKTIPALSIRDDQSAARIHALSPEHPAVLADAWAAGKHGGTGKVFDHRLITDYFDKRRIFLAGGLGPDTISGVMTTLHSLGRFPYALDLSSGVEESPGVKSPEKLRAFFHKFTEGLES